MEETMEKSQTNTLSVWFAVGDDVLSIELVEGESMSVVDTSGASVSLKKYAKEPAAVALTSLVASASAWIYHRGGDLDFATSKEDEQSHFEFNFHAETFIHDDTLGERRVIVELGCTGTWALQACNLLSELVLESAASDRHINPASIPLKTTEFVTLFKGAFELAQRTMS
jgi:hypothetical protein